MVKLRPVKVNICQNKIEIKRDKSGDPTYAIFLAQHLFYKLVSLNATNAFLRHKTSATLSVALRWVDT